MFLGEAGTVNTKQMRGDCGYQLKGWKTVTGEGWSCQEGGHTRPVWEGKEAGIWASGTEWPAPMSMTRGKRVFGGPCPAGGHSAGEQGPFTIHAKDLEYDPQLRREMTWRVLGQRVARPDESFEEISLALSL